MKINGIEVVGITDDSRKVRPGWAFFAIRGNAADGTQYIGQARNAGAAIIITDEDYEGESFKVPDIRRFLLEAAMEFFAPLPENIIAVTGTNGKTSTVHFCRYILENLGKNAASIGTQGLIYKDSISEIGIAGNTTPNPILLCKALQDLKAKGCDYVAIEASSVGLEQERINALPIKVAAFTNLSRDHLEIHGTMENYFAAKKKLFTEVLTTDGVAVLNTCDDNIYEQLSSGGRRVISYGDKENADLRLIGAEYKDDGQKVSVEINRKNYEYELEALGSFQTYNSLCAIGMIMGLGFEVADIIKAIQNMPAPKGRLQFIGTPVKGGGVYVDFAHTPDALRALLSAARKFCKGRLMVLCGTGAPRDAGKRPLMGEVMQELADVVYITDGNYRIYDPAPIREQIASKCPKGIKIPGRRNAIARAVKDMRDGDVLILAGAGDEHWVHVGTGRYHFSDIEEAKKAIDLRLCFPGMDLPL
jgi:UDP-N-acetylmuramoyl-L-alanyl-D-glutamate--2,6-diaminopimelate ligase